MTIHGEMRGNTCLDAVLTGSSYNLPRVELEASHRMIKLDGFEYASCPKVPDLVEGLIRISLRLDLKLRTRMVLSRLPLAM